MTAPPTGPDDVPAATGSPRRRGRRAWAIGVPVAALLSVAAVLGGTTLWVADQSEGRVLTVEQAPIRDVSLVLGAGVYPDGRPTPFLQARLDVALELYRTGRTRVIIVSGDNRSHAYDEPTVMRSYLVQHGVPIDRVVRDFAGRDSYDSCTRARRIFGVDALTLVSQGYHLPRAVTLCRAEGVDAVGVGDWTMSQGAYRSTWEWGERREIGAKVKAAWDVVSGRDPVLGPPESAVRDALRHQ
ncbi:vancomycin high temperature exclusion protein [Arsenicicoccus dermatophilus]|uniref:SanA/YdcF family protein n=1 Tax=Arsenicicoccus dermatophilus TaxID=1076331 RepID=UPI003916F0FC